MHNCKCQIGNSVRANFLKRDVLLQIIGIVIRLKHISVRILLKQLDYSLTIAMAFGLINYHLMEISSSKSLC